MSPDTLTVLLASPYADEIMAMTKSLRAFYAGCRVEAVYSLEEALEWAQKQAWQLALIDDSLLPGVSDALQQLHARARRPAMIVIGSLQEGPRALDTIRRGADYYLIKTSPTFLTDLPLMTHAVLEKRELRTKLDWSEYLYGRLTETLSAVVYQLDAEGRFSTISAEIRTYLHYDPQDLLGQSYSVLLLPTDREVARWRFNERRSDARAQSTSTVRLIDKYSPHTLVEMEVTARSLYDHDRRFIGTIGILRPVSPSSEEETRRMLSSLRAPLAELLSQTQSVLASIHGGTKQAPAPPAQPTPPPQHPGPPPTEDTESAPTAWSERRRRPRYEVRLEAQLVIDGRSWEGTAVGISDIGIYLLLKGRPPITAHQRGRLAFTSEVGVLEVSAQVIAVRETPGETTDPRVVMGIALQLAPLTDVETALLTSLIDGIRMQTVSVSVRMLFLPPSQGTSLPHKPRAPASEEDESPAVSDRRLAARLALSLQGTMSISGSPGFYEVTVTNLSATGCRLRLSTLPSEASPPGATIRITIPAVEVEATRPADDCCLNGHIVWTDPSPASQTAQPREAGIRFFPDDTTQSAVERLMTPHLTSGSRMEGAERRPRVVSRLMECRTSNGARIALYHDHPEPLLPTSPIVVLSPDFGQTKHDALVLAYYFAVNGFHVVRYDHTNHVGESDGGVTSTTLSAMAADLRTVVDYAANQWPTSPMLVMTVGFSARTALRALRGLTGVKLLSMVAPILDVQAAVRDDQEQDLVAAAVEGRTHGIATVRGLNIDMDHWLRDVLMEDYADLASTLRDVGQVRIPVALIAAQEHSEGASMQLRAFRDALGDHMLDWHVQSFDARRPFDDPIRAAPLCQHIFERARTWFYPLNRAKILTPSHDAVRAQRQVEQERMRLQHRLLKTEHLGFWQDYLDRSHCLLNFSDYWHMLDHVYRLLGPFDGSTRVLDAGCGTGSFGTYLLIMRSLQEPGQAVDPGLEYIGVDVVKVGLDRAKDTLIRVAAELRGKLASTVVRNSAMAAGLACADLDRALPFHSNTIDRVVCNLVLGYVQDPLFTLRELLRVLAPGGKLVVTNFMPHADLSQIYRNFLALPRTASEVEQAKELMRATGHLTERTREGGFRLFDRQELAMLCLSSGAAQPRIYSTFANQAYIVVAEKPASVPGELRTAV